MTARSHPCALPGCPVVLPAQQLMCARHWHMVPLTTQALILREHRTGQTAATATEAWHQAVAAAVSHVQAKESRGS